MKERTSRPALMLAIMLVLCLLTTTAFAKYDSNTNYAAVMIAAAAKGDTAAYNAAASARAEKIADRQQSNPSYTDPGIAGSGGTISVSSVCYVVSGGSVGSAQNTSSSGGTAATQDQVRAAAAAATAALVDGTITSSQMQTVASTIAAVNSGTATQEQVDNASKILCVAQGNSTSDNNVKAANMSISAGTMASYETLDESGNRVYWEGGRAYRQDSATGSWVAADMDALPGAVTINQKDLNAIMDNRVAYLSAATAEEKAALHSANETLRANYDYQGGTNGSFFDGTATKVKVSSGGGDVEINAYIIASSCTTGGTITPSGSFYYTQGSRQQFTISVKNGFTLKYVLVDDKPIGAVKSYTFSNIQGNHTIHAQVISNASLDSLTVATDHTQVKSGYGVAVTCVPQATHCVIDSVTAENSATGKTYNLTLVSGKYCLPINPASPTHARVDYLPVSLADGNYQWTVTVTAHNADDPANKFSKAQTLSYTVKGVMYEDDFTGNA